MYPGTSAAESGSANFWSSFDVVAGGRVDGIQDNNDSVCEDGRLPCVDGDIDGRVG